MKLRKCPLAVITLVTLAGCASVDQATYSSPSLNELNQRDRARMEREIKEQRMVDANARIGQSE
jgi:uncharacterized protein YceK